MNRAPAFLVLVMTVAMTASGQVAEIRSLERERMLRAAEAQLKQEPETITSFPAPRSSGGLHDFSSEGDYWWPDPKNPGGPYIQRDGMTNPDNFVQHRLAMTRFSIAVGDLTSAWLLTGNEKYAAHAAKHLRAWFIDEKTRMNPDLKYAQSIKGRVTGRGVGIIDTVHLIEVSRSAQLLPKSRSWAPADGEAVRSWFREYLDWMTTHPYGIEERDSKNNHATCWVMQAAAFASLTGNEAILENCRLRFKSIVLPGQMASDGSFPLELKRTKPYGYSLFNLDAMAAICRILSRPGDNLWEFSLPDGRSMRKGMEFLFPYIADKSSWPHGRDVMYFEEWPVRQPCLLFAGLALKESRYLGLWKKLEANSTNAEVIRNLPIRHPVLWLE
jgi:hypothetical protein